MRVISLLAVLDPTDQGGVDRKKTVEDLGDETILDSSGLPQDNCDGDDHPAQRAANTLASRNVGLYHQETNSSPEDNFQRVEDPVRFQASVSAKPLDVLCHELVSDEKERFRTLKAISTGSHVIGTPYTDETESNSVSPRSGLVLHEESRD